MRRIRARFVVWLLVLGPAVAGVPSRGAVPVLEGRLGGDLVVPRIPEAPPLHWTVDLRLGEGAARRLLISAEGEGTKLSATASVDLGGNGTWSLTAATLDLARWRSVMARWAGAAVKGVVFSGTVSVTGHGTLRAGRPAGELLVVLHDGQIQSPAGGWALAGVSLSGRFGFGGETAGFQSTAPLTFQVQTITTTRFGARNLAVYGRLESASTFAVSSARLEIAGGDMTVAPCRIALQPFRVEAEVTVNHIGLQDVAALVPTAVRSAFGRVDGTARIGWTAATGFEVGTGQIVLRSDEPAQVTLRPFPGLFTGNLPPWMLKLPRWLVRWSVPGLRQAEMGRIPIEASSLQVTFSPTPDAEGRTAIVHLIGVPDYAIKTPITLEANIRGPLRTFIELTRAGQVSVGLH